MASPNPNQPGNFDRSKYLEPKTVIRSGLDPSWTIKPYRITTDQILDFLKKKVDKYVPGARVQIQPRYIENRFAMKKQGKATAPSTSTMSYASLLVALSADTVDRGKLNPAYRWIVEGSRDVRMVDGVYNHLIKKFRYNRDELKAILKDYSALDHLKERFGITEEYLQNLIKLSNPVLQPNSKGEDGWVIFAASTEKIIEDMLTEVMIFEPKPEFIRANDPDAPRVQVVPKGLPGTMEIVKVNRITQDLVEFLVYVHVGQFRAIEDPSLRKLFDSFK